MPQKSAEQIAAEKAAKEQAERDKLEAERRKKTKKEKSVAIFLELGLCKTKTWKDLQDLEEIWEALPPKVNQ